MNVSHCLFVFLSASGHLCLFQLVSPRPRLSHTHTPSQSLPLSIVPRALPPPLPQFSSRLPSTSENYSDTPLPSPPISRTQPSPTTLERGRGCGRAKFRHILHANQQMGGRGLVPGWPGYAAGRVREALMATPPGRPIKGESSCGGPQPDFCEPTVGFYSMAIRATMDLSAIYEVSTG